ncbi:MAG: amidohydrolase [Bacteroidetes bacterium]|nr:MAG: amidohydrolase [Bacteroidota bacterium]
MQQRILAMLFAIVLIGTFFFIVKTSTLNADMLLVNGAVYTLDEHNTVAQAIAISGDKIVATGSTGELMRRYPGVMAIDLKGKTVLPGLTDGHAHILGEGSRIFNLDLVGTTSPQQIAEIVAKRAAEVPAGSWIMGRGWDQNDWDVKEFPTKELLDNAAPNNPVKLRRVDGHADWVNSKVLELAGINATTPDTTGGKIVRDASGNPTGVLIDNASDLLDKAVPKLTNEDVEQRLIAALNECASLGLTQVHDMGVDLQTIAVMKKIIDEGKCPIRIYALIGGAGETWNYYLMKGPELGYGNNMLNVRGIKMYIDGALGSRGAALLDDYSDDPGNKGLTVNTEEQLEAVCRQAIEHGFQVCTHAIGDRGNNIVLNVYEKVMKKNSKDSHFLRWRIEHCQVLQPSDIPRFAELGIIPAMQPTHATSDMYWAEARLGQERVKYAYAWRSLLEAGSIIVGGSDFPVESVNPLLGFYAGATRSDVKGYPADGWHREQKMTREESARAFSQWAAYGSFEEQTKGTIEVGKWADLTILSKDIMTIPDQEILSANVEMTIVGGKIVFQK